MMVKVLVSLLICFFIPVFVIGQPEGEAMHLPGTELMSKADVEGIRSRMIEGMIAYFKRELSVIPELRTEYWNYDFTSRESYDLSIQPNRDRFKHITGITDQRLGCEALILHETSSQRSLVTGTPGYRVYSVSWPVLEGISGTGLWVEPVADPIAQVIVIPDADHSPEMILGLAPGLSYEYQYARRFAEIGCRVLIPVIIDRRCIWSGKPGIAMTNQPHREYIYRRAYELGRHIIGYEVQKVLGAVDWFESDRPDLPVLVSGYGEGGLLALYSGAVDTRIDGTLVSGYFNSREGLWQEPVYRNVWGLLKEFGDAEIAGMVAPRLLVIEACKGPESDGPPKPPEGHRDVAAPGSLKTPATVSVRSEAERAGRIYSDLGVPEKFQFVESALGFGSPASAEAVDRLLRGAGVERENLVEGKRYQMADSRVGFDSDLRMKGEVNELMFHMDQLIAGSSEKRRRFWKEADATSPESWELTTDYYRDYFWEELMGRMPDPTRSFNARSRKRYETGKWTGYWVELDVWEGITAGGILLVPKGINDGEQRPVVVFQHGLSGLPEPLVDPEIESVYYS
ncbi:MAG: hypothetical protein PHN68_10165, partial [Prolixibacteraceae bacterium]|nr:hypothetical protein [Prolixibacteraceae bacterium]